MRRSIPFFFSFLLTLVLGGCASLRGPEVKETTDLAPVSWSQHEASMKAMIHWTVKGHILLQSKKGGERARLHWAQNEENTHLSLIGPLGSGKVELMITPQRTHLSRSNGFQQDAPTPEALLTQLQGWPIPVRPARFWLQGLPDVDAHQKRWNLNGTVHSFESHGWRIHYQHYTEQPPYYPKSILFRRAEYSVTVSIDEWRVTR